MDGMDFEVLPGPSLAELAGTALASAAAAEIDDARSPGDPVYPGRVPALAPVRDGRDGSPLLLPVTGSVVEHQLTARREAVTVTVPADGVAAVRLAFPDGPVTSLQEVPASIRTALTCHCEFAPRRR
jgi:hypothetical protein